MSRERRTLTTDQSNTTQSQSGNKETVPSDTKDLLPGGQLDGRSRSVKRYKEILDSLISDMGYTWDDVPISRAQLAKRAAGLSWRLELCEIAQLNGESYLPNGEYLPDIDISKEINTLTRVLSTLGIDRKQKDSGAFTLDDYFSRHK